MDDYKTVWSFETANFSVKLSVAPEDTAPEDSFEFPEDVEAVRSGAVEWFQARVTVHYKGAVIGSDYLGACAYNSTREFYTSHRDLDPMNRNCTIMRHAHGENVSICHYFPSMVAEAVREARKYLREAPRLRCA